MNNNSRIFSWKNLSGSIFLNRKAVALMLLFLVIPFVGWAQQSSIKGIVTDEDNQPLIGASVTVKGSSNGTMSDADGAFSLNNVNNASVLIVSYLGYVSQEVAVGSQKDLRITLKDNSRALDEVIVVGYGVQKKSVTTAAIAKVKAEDMEKLTPSRVENVLKGQVSGVQITSNSGQPGSDAKVRIRGIGTTNNSDPLYIVDGMVISGGISNLNPSDIESVEVLKDAASAAVYGSRAANGVILITTKTGKNTNGKASINYNFSYGLQNPWKKKSVLNAEEYMIIQNEMSINGGGAVKYTPAQIAAAANGQSTYTDWQDKVFNYDAPVMDHQLNISGGGERGNYFLSLGYFDQDGIVGGNYNTSNYNRLSIRSNNEYRLIDETKTRSFLNKLSIGVNVTYSRANSIGVPGGTNSEFGSVLGSAIGLSPLMSVYATEQEAATILKDHPYAVKDASGRVYQLPPAGFQEIVNPVASMERPQKKFNEEDKFMGNFYAELDILKGLKFRTSYGFDLAFWGNHEYRFPFYLSSQTRNENEEESFASEEMNRGYTWLWENVLTYTFKLAEKHNFTLLAGQSAQEYNSRKLYGQDFDLNEYDPYKANIDYATADRSKERTSGGTSSNTRASYFGRLSYDFNEKYMLQLIVRQDGSSYFGAGQKWGTFPSVSAGWNVLNEEFMQGIRPEWFDAFKLRAGWGINGNDNIDQFAYTSLMDGGQNYYYGSGDSERMIYGTSPARLANPVVTWEQSKQTDIGFDARFLKSALTFTFDYYKKTTDNMLKEQPIPGYIGLKSPWANAGKMENWGLEFESGYKFKVRDFHFGIAANATYVQNKLINLGNASGQDSWGSSGASGVENFIFARNGMVYPFFYGYKTDGILQNDAEAAAYNAKYKTSAVAGDVRFKDLDNNNVIDDKDRQMIGKGMPDWTYGLTLNADWKNIDLYVFFQGAEGCDIFDLSQRADIAGINRPTWILDRWTGPGTSDRIPRVTSNDINKNWQASDLYIKSGSYCRLKNLQIGYTIPQNITKKAFINKFRVFVAGENLLTFTKYKDGFDPEVSGADDNNPRFQGVDKGMYPQARTVSFGLNVTF